MDRTELAALAGSQDPVVRRLLGDALLGRAPAVGEAERGALVDEAERHYRASLSLDPTQAPALVGLAGARLLAGADLEDAAGILEVAHVRQPADVETALALSELALQLGRSRHAREVLQRATGTPHVRTVHRSRLERIGTLRERAGLGTGRVDTRGLPARIALSSPEGDEVSSVAPFLEVRGHAGLYDATRHEVLLVLDTSTPTRAAAGFDVDGDGHTGRNFVPAVYGRFGGRADAGPPQSTDPGDSVLAAMLVTAQAILVTLDPATTRAGLASGVSELRLGAPLGDPSAALAAVDDIRLGPPGNLYRERRLQSLIRGAAATFEAAGASGEPRSRSIVLLSGGPASHGEDTRNRGRLQALVRGLGEAGITIHAFHLGTDVRIRELMRRLAVHGRGSFAAPENPFLASLDQTRPRYVGLSEVRIRNLSNGSEARAPRVFPDGSFDGIVGLVPGENRIEVTGLLEGRDPVREVRTLTYRRPEEPTEEERRTAAAMMVRMRYRSAELYLQHRVAAGRADPESQRRRLEIEPELPQVETPPVGAGADDAAPTADEPARE